MAIFFEVTDFTGEPVNTEPDKCAGWQWFALDELPDQMIPYARQALTHYVKGDRTPNAAGWSRPMTADRPAHDVVCTTVCRPCPERSPRS